MTPLLEILQEKNPDTTGSCSIPPTHSSGVSTALGKRMRDQPCPVNESFVVGDYVSLHSSKLGTQHMHCRVVQVVGGVYRLFCDKGVLLGTYARSDLKSLSSDCHISLDNWRVAGTISLQQVVSDGTCLKPCHCPDRPVSDVTLITDLIQDSDMESDSESESKTWLSNELYSLTLSNKEEVLSPSGWLSDSIIEAAQLLILQQYPYMSGLQTPLLQQNLSFQVHKRPFVQIICVRNSHWVTVSNVGCTEGQVNVYDSMYSSVPKTTIQIIASLLFTSGPQLEIRMMDVRRQPNSSDCGILAIAFAYDICSGADPCKVKFDHKSTRQHLVTCLEKCNLLRFPVLGDRRSVGIKNTQCVDLHCSCRLPEVQGEDMAKCEGCKVWYHKHCMDIPSEVFNSEDVPWKCKSCEKQ